jgi:enhancing lycopene biosynthesis protein 2
MKKKFAVVLAGCGVFDGSEIHEVVLTLLAIDRHGAGYQCFAPDIQQAHVVNHLTKQEMKESRNVLVESARLARGNILPLSRFRAEDFDAVVFPGGFGVAKNLMSYAFDGVECSVLPEAENCIQSMVKAGKPVGALCISPVLIAKILGNVTVTIGDDRGTAADIVKMGGNHEVKGHGQVVVDRQSKVVTSPCYMIDATVSQIASDAEAVISTILSMD